MSQRATFITWHQGLVSSDERERLLGQRGAVLWFTGLSGSGKSTIAREVEQALLRRGRAAYVLDGDNLRHGLCADLGFSPEDRQENIRRVGAVAQLFADAGVLTLAAFVSPYRADRDGVRRLLPEGRFFEIFVDTPVEVCEARDPKGLYAKARQGLITDFTGIHAPYEAPLSPEVVLRPDQTPGEAAERVIRALEERELISAENG